MTRDALHLSDHAIARYRQRHDQHATVEQIRDILENGKLRHDRPACVAPGSGRDGAPVAYVVCGEAVFPLARKDNGYLALTCLKRQTIPKADRRAMREQAREDQEWGYAA